jgi:probable F420-dependent oxidoreductase
VRLGVGLPCAGEWATPENQVRVAQRAEALGYDSLWVFQRLLYALAPRNDYYGAPGQPWPAAFESVVDPIVALTYAAAATRRVTLGTAVLIMPFYSPVVLAKQLASLDRVSGGRLHVGLGLGWSEDEYAAVGAPFESRGARADEFLTVLKAAWTDDVVEFSGRFYQVPRSRIAPRPVQRPHPPITLGGYAPGVLRRAVTLADGYDGGNLPLDRIAPLLAELRTEAEKAGRDPRTLHLVSRGVVHVHATPQGPDRRPLWGTLDEIREDVRRYAEAGLTELFLEMNFTPGGARLERVLDVMEALAQPSA